MLSNLKGRFLGKVGEQAFPWMILRGPLKGSRWSLLPSSGYWRSSYEPDCAEAILKNIPTRGSCWDIGAHFGYFTLLMARELQGSGREVVSLEPSENTYQRLNLHLRWNKLSNVRTFQVAASDREGAAELLSYGSSTSPSNHLAYPGEWTENPECGKDRITTIPMDELRRKHQLQGPGLVKIDVEGHGLSVLLGMQKTLLECRPVLIYSLHTPEETAGMNGFLEKLGYRPTRIIRREDPDSETDSIAFPLQDTPPHL